MDSFKTWLLNEMGYFALPSTMNFGGVLVDAIDMRFEDYPKTTEEEKDLVRRLMLPLKPDPFFGRFPQSNRYIVFDGTNYKISVSPPKNWRDYVHLPDTFKNGYTWWDYAAGLYGNKVVKRPLRSRVYD